jgi:hypothetical protein
MLQPLLDFYKARVGKSYTLVFGKDDRVKAVEGTEKIAESAPGNVGETIRRELNPDKLKKATNEALDVLPGKSVMKGDRWQRVQNMDVGGGQILTFTNYYEYMGTVEKEGKTLDKIGIFASEVKYSVEPDGMLPAQVVNSDLKIDSSTGALLFDRERGMFVENTHLVRITGPLTLSVNGMELPAKLDLTIDTVSVVEK